MTAQIAMDNVSACATGVGIEPAATASCAAIEIIGLSKTYVGVQALKDIDLSIAPGEVVALLGPNGAGKSTLVETIVGLRNPDKGIVRVLGDEVTAGERGFLARLGLQLQRTDFFVNLTGRDYINLFKNIFPRVVPEEQLIAEMALGAFIDRPLRKVSGGQRQRIALALAMLNDPDIIILDEPTVGLDPIAREEFWTLIRTMHDGGRRTLIFTTHYMEEVAALASRVVFIADGELRMDGAVADMVAMAGQGAATLDEAYRRLAVTQAVTQGVKQ